MKRRYLKNVVALIVSVLLAAPLFSLAQDMEDGWDIKLQDFFQSKKRGKVPFTVYARSKDGVWKAAVGSSRSNFRPGEQPRRAYNTSWQHLDMSQVHIKDGVMKGKMTMHMTPDLWVPVSQRSFPVVFEVDAKINDKGLLEGTWTSSRPNIDEPTLDGMNFAGGRITSFTKPQKAFNLPKEFTIQMNFQGTKIGGAPKFNQRCLVMFIGVRDGKVVKASHGTLTQKRSVVSRSELDPELQTLARISEDGFAGTVRIPTTTLDMEPCEYVIDFEGTFQGGLATGVNKVTVKREGKDDVVFPNSFDGSMRPGISRTVYKSVLDEVWFVDVKDHTPVEAGERPRLLFRKSDLPALRAKAKTPEGQAMLQRLRYQLDGKDGTSEAAVYSTYTHAYMGGGYRHHSMNNPGVYTFSHIVGYGLLYQLTGEQKYADLGKHAFERAMAGQRDRDDRYSFRKPGGALRAGPVIGWTAVGYDLCYDGWDEAFREKATRALAEYSEGDGKHTIESLVRGSKPPGSNHFGMQIGGATLALLAIDKEPWVDQKKVDTLLRIARQNMIRNVAEGFGDGGFFQEGDGTGSMATYIAYLGALQGMKNAKGKDMVNNGRPHVPMMTLKWVYLSKVGKAGERKGKVSLSINFPIRGEYGHNVWAREGLSGAGYFGQGFGAVRPKDVPALLGFYDMYFKAFDAANGTPNDTISVYPHNSVMAFVNWPMDVEPVNPGEVLPLTYTDSKLGFFAWRNQWSKGNDFVMSILANRATGGYMASRADQNLKVDGKPRADVSKAKGVKNWWMTEKGDKSILTFNRKDATLLVDFSKASGEDVLLVTTLPAEGGTAIKFGRTKVNFLFPRSAAAPEVSVDGNVATIGGQKIQVDGNKLSFVE